MDVKLGAVEHRRSVHGSRSTGSGTAHSLSTEEGGISAIFINEISSFRWLCRCG